MRCWSITGATVTYTDCFKVFKDVTNPGIIDPAPGDDALWRSSNAATYNVDFVDQPQTGSGLGLFHVRITSGAGQGGTVYQEWASQGLNSGTTYYNTNWPLAKSSFDAMREGKNYVSVRIFDRAGNYSDLTDAFFVNKDTTPPAATNLQAGDTLWRRANDGSYHVEFFDTPPADGSRLDRFQARASTVAGGTGPWLADWADTVLAINTTYYTSPWPVTSSTWELLGNCTNFISLRAADTAGNFSATLADAFFILKDTQAPVITDSQDETTEPWRASNPGAAWNIGFADNVSKLHTAQFSSLPSLPWTNIFTATGAASVTSPWDIGAANWDLLPNGTSHVSARVWDTAGSTATALNVFVIKKDTAGPSVIDNQAGYDNWLAANPGSVWNVDFEDNLALLSTAAYRISSGTQLAGALTEWTTIFAGINQPLYSTNWGINALNWELTGEGTSYVTVRAFDNLGNSATYYDVFHVRKDTSNPTAENHQANTMVQDPGGIDSIDIDFFDTGKSLLSNAEYTIRPSTGLPGSYIVNWTALAEGINATYYADNWSMSVSFSALPNLTTSYVSVRASDFAGNTTTWVDAFALYKNALGPSVMDNQSGDDNWRASAEGITYNVDFQSNSGEELTYFEVLICSGAGRPQDKITANWFTLAENLQTVLYTDDWAIPVSTFNALPQGINYVSVRIHDAVPSSTTISDVFYIKKDTAPPLITSLQADATFFAAAAGALYNVDFNDAGAGVTNAQYLISSSSADPEGTAPGGWATIFTQAPAPSYTADWPLAAWPLLQEAATNYISVRAYDALLQCATAYAAFYVLKDTTPPDVPSLTVPAANALLSNGNINFQWSASADYRSGMASYTLELATAADFSGLVISSITQLNSATLSPGDGTRFWRVRSCDAAGNLSSWSQQRSFLLDTSPPSITDNQQGYDVWLSSDPGNAWNIAFGDIGSGLTTAQYKIHDAAGEGGAIVCDWQNIFTVAAGTAAYDTKWSVLFSSCSEGYNYVTVRCFDRIGLSSTTVDAFFIKKDTSAPGVSANAEAGGDSTWRSAAKTGGYNVDFADAGSGLDDIEYAVSTGTLLSGGLKIAWTPVASNLNQGTYTTDWPVNFVGMQEGGTNYVSVRLKDMLSNTSTFYDLFFVRKDITKPSIASNMSAGSDSTWRASNPGAIYNVDFNDLPGDGSALSKLETKVMLSPLLAGATVWDWTDAILSMGATFYAADWALSFDSLAEGKNYLSVRIFDGAANYDSLPDVFFVLKDTTPPVVVVNQAGDDTWRYENNATYNVDFRDAASGSGISSFEVRASTVQEGAPWLTDWVVATTTNTYIYTRDWQLPAAVWNELHSSVTNYIWLRSYDFAGNVSTATGFAFYVKKDTAGVSIANNETGQDPQWRAASRAYNVDFYSAGSAPLAAAEYSAWTGEDFTGDNAVGWSAVPGFTQGAEFTGNWAIDNFSQLRDGATNWVSVRCWNTAGATVTAADVFFVLKDTTQPASPSLLAPLNAAATGQLTVAFDWQDSNDLASGTSSYYLEVSGDSGFITLAAGATSYVSFQAVTLAMQSTYYWRVSAFDAAGNRSGASSVYSLQADTSSPQPPTPLSPLDDSATNYMNQSFSWQEATDEGPAGISGYLLEISTSLSFIPVSTSTPAGASGKTIALATGLWRWRLSAIDRAGNYSTPSPAWALVVDTVPPQAVTLLTPAPVAISSVTYASFSWNGGSDAPAGIAGYETTVATSQAFTSLAWSSATALTGAATYFSQGTYYWRARALDAAGNYGAYSSTYSFIIDTSAPASPALSAPSDDSDTNALSKTFQWTPQTDAGPAGILEYELYISTSSDCQPVLSSSATSLTGVPVTFASQGKYYWRARSKDKAYNYSDYSSTWAVTIDTTAPVITDYQQGDDAWHSEASSLYNVDAFDTPGADGSGISYFRYIVYASTTQAGAPSGNAVSGWQTIYSTTLAHAVTYYADNWDISQTFPILGQGYNFVFAAASDFAGNASSTETYAFHVKKDTGAPYIAINETAAPSWQKEGKTYDVDFLDAGAGVSVSSCTAWTGQSMTGTQSLGWATIIDSSTAVTNYSDNWPLAFDLLLPGTNYVSLRLSDALGQQSTYYDVFRVLKDTIAPAAVTDLAASPAAGAGGLNLQWTAPIDDLLTGGATDPVKAYLVKYKTTAFSGRDDALTSGTTFQQSWQPAVPHSHEQRLVTGLSEGVTYYTGILSIDKAGSISAAVSTASATATRVAPAAITSLAASIGDFPGEIKLSWIASGDNDREGQASGYLVKYSSNPIGNETDFANAATYTQAWAPLTAGGREEQVLQGLTAGNTYFAAVKVFDGAGNYSVISNTVSTSAAPSGPASGMITFGEGTNATPKYRAWTGASWNPEPPALPQSCLSAAANTRYMRLKSCNIVRDQKILGLLAYDGSAAPDGNLFVQLWDGQAGTWTDLGQMNSASGNMYSAYRGFDIAYEQNSGRALIVYGNGTAGQLSYRLWSSTQGAWVGNAQTLPLSGTSGNVYWVKLSARPNSDAIMLATLDANSDIFAAVWNGAGWVNTSTKTLTAAAAIATEKCFDIEWERQSGRAMALWGEGTSTRYSLWSSTAGAWTVLGTAGPNIAATANWISLAADPSSDRLALSSVDGSSDWNIVIWNGSQWPAALGTDWAEPATTLETNAARCAEIAWEKDSGKCLAAGAATANALYFNWSLWTSGSGWSALAPDTYNWADDLNYVELTADPNTSKILALGIDITGSLRTRNWSGSWSGGSAHTSAVSGWTSGSNLAYQPAQIALELHDTSSPGISNNQSGDAAWRRASASYNVTFNDAGGSMLASVRTAVYTKSGLLDSNKIKDFSAGDAELAGMNTDLWTSSWALCGTTWGLLAPGTNYISVRIFDGVGNDNTAYDAFYIWKDTQPPSITNNEAGGDNTWTNAGRSYSLSFNDQETLSKLDLVQYCVYSGPAQSGEQILNWTFVAGPGANVASHAGLSLNFELLAHNTNYVSVRTADIAGSSVTIVDAFRILKDTQAPAAITDLAAAAGPYRGTVQLSWRAPGDDGQTGENSRGGYTIKLATYALTTEQLFAGAGTWTSAMAASSPGAQESVIVTGLEVGATWFFAVKTRDKVPNWAAVSNSTGTLPRTQNVYINEVFASAPAGSDWAELYNNTENTVSLDGWKLYYNQGTVDAPASEAALWTGTAGDSIASGALLVINGLDVSADGGTHLKLTDGAGRTVDTVQWPALAAGNSFARIDDGCAEYLEIDPTPTKGYASSISTAPVKINEVDYASAQQFVEFYNISSDTAALAGWKLRNGNNTAFTFTRKVYPASFNGIAFSSVDNGGNSWTDSMGSGGLSGMADFLALENESGQVADRVTWRSGANASYYTYKAAPAPFTTAAPGEIIAPATIGRKPYEGADSGNDFADFGSFAAPSLGARNTNGTPAPANSLSYPQSSSYLPRNFKIDLTLGADSSAGANDTLWFIRASGAADAGSPHVYRLADLSFILSDLNVQTTIQSGTAFYDMDGHALSDGAIYKIILNADSAAGEAPQVVRTSVYYDGTVHRAAIRSVTPPVANAGAKTGLAGFELINQSPAGANNIELESVDIRFELNSGDEPLTTGQAQALFNEILLVADNETRGTPGLYQADIDTYTLVSIEGTNIILDSSGVITLPVLDPEAAQTTVSAGAARTYFIAARLGESAQNTNSFRARIISSSHTAWRDAESDVIQPPSGNEILISSPTIILPAQPPAGSSYPATITSAATGITGAILLSESMDTAFAATSGGKLCALKEDGTPKWTFDAGSPIVNCFETGSFYIESDTYVYVATQAGLLYKIKDTGAAAQDAWGAPRNFGSAITSDIQYNTNPPFYLYLGTSEGKLFKFSTEGSDAPGWNTNQGITGAIKGSPAVDEYSAGVNAAWTVTDEGGIYRLNNVDGGITVSTTTTGTINSSPFLIAGYSDPSRNTHDIYFGDTDGYLRARTSANLYTLPANWQDVYVSSPLQSTPVYGDRTRSIYLGADNGNFYCVDASSGGIYWTFRTQGPIRTTPIYYRGWDAADKGRIYFGSDDGYFYGLDALTGQLLPDFPIATGAEIRGSPTMCLRYDQYDNLILPVPLYFGSNDGKVYCVEINP
ncbi:MAG: hypothetical protein A2219_04550 [Elusimicrobia bacterium RIFOXYA2_FULL_50_26]|nr:MAG: hypothetical protein A2219_04550 [Elusimicrobia bacterium RIFOXYA2_FULL_50_26]